MALALATNGPATVFAELFGAFVSGEGREERHNFQAGTTILLSPRFQIDFRAGGGLVESEADWFIGAGLAFRVPR